MSLLKIFRVLPLVTIETQCFAKHDFLDSTPPVPQHERLHISLVCGPDSLGFDKDAHMAVLTLHQAENCHPAGRIPAILIQGLEARQFWPKKSSELAPVECCHIRSNMHRQFRIIHLFLVKGTRESSNWSWSSHTISRPALNSFSSKVIRSSWVDTGVQVRRSHVIQLQIGI
jgi:hypothetical protein